MLHLDQLKSQWAVDCIIDQSRLDEASLRTANLHQKYLDILTDYKMRIFKNEKEYLSMKGNRSRYYMGQMTKEELNAFSWSQYQYKTPLKSELERLLETDDILLNMLDKQSYLKICFEYCEEILKALRDRNWQIKTAVEWRKFEAGA